jgi:tubulin-specific chaperone A
MADEGGVAADPQKVRNLKIKTGVVRRLGKEKLSYEKEVTTQEEKIEKFRAEGKDEFFMKQQLNCLNESKMMIPDVHKRFVVSMT